MMRSMFSGVSGLRVHQTRMDVIGNNIANVNTVGFKASRVTFRELFSQTMRGASRPSADRGGTNPMQVGLGVTLGAISRVHTVGNMQSTGNPLDMGLEGDGFFVLGSGGGRVYSRAGTFELDGEGYLVDRSTGLKVQGWRATNGVFPELRESNLSDIQIRLGQAVPARATNRVVLADNLDARLNDGDQVELTIDVFDSQGNLHAVIFQFTKTGTNQWDWEAYWPDTSDPANVRGSGTVTFDENGAVQNVSSSTINFTPSGVQALNITVDFDAVTQYAAPTTVDLFSQNGYASGVLEGITIGADGVITGAFTNGITQDLGRIAVANFENPAGLLDTGGGFFIPSNNSGIVSIGAAGTGAFAALAPGSLEMSNVDLSEEFTDMIVTQRGFQANARVITSSDELLQELVNLKR